MDGFQATLTSTVLVTGATGFIGRNVMAEAAELAVRAVAVSRGDDLRNHLEGSHVVGVVNCAGLADLMRCEREPDEARRANAELPEMIASLCKSAHATFVHVSTDGLFSNGVRPAPAYWTTSDEPRPVTAYGQSKLDGEERVSRVGWGEVIRLAPVGLDAGTGRGLIAFLAKKHREATAKDVVVEVPGFDDVWFTPAPLRELCGRLLALAATPPPSPFSVRHWGTDIALTKADLLARLVEAAELRLVVKKVRRAELANAHAVPLDQSLRCQEPWTLDELIAAATRDLHELLRNT